jgi:small multidrug resistance family-3 protein
MKTALLYPVAALLEIAGCYALWAWLRNGRSPWWAVPSMIALVMFAWLLTRVPVSAAGRAFAATVVSISQRR